MWSEASSLRQLNGTENGVGEKGSAFVGSKMEIWMQIHLNEGKCAGSGHGSSGGVRS